MPRRIREQLRKRAILHLTESPQIDLRRVLRQLRAQYGVKYVACEGGPALFRSLLVLRLVDQLNLTIAPFLFGGRKAPTLTGVNSVFLARTVRCSLIDMNVAGEECFLTYKIKH